MKKVLLFLMVFTMLISSVPVFAAEDVTVEIDSVPVECKDVNGNVVPPMLIDGTTYLPVRAIANALNLEIEWDGATKSVFINGVTDSVLTDNVNIYINGLLFTATDVNGKVVHPILKDGTTYLPVRAIGEAFHKRVSWIQETKTVVLSTSWLKTDFIEGADYAIINKASGKALSVTDEGLVLEAFNNYKYQSFKFIRSDVDGYYYIQSSENGKNFDVNGNSKSEGAKIITYNAGTADNQKFAVEHTEEGYIIYALSSSLPVEDSVNVPKQNTLRSSLTQRWEILEFTPVEKEIAPVYYTLSVDDLSFGSMFLMERNGLTMGITFDNPNPIYWSLTANEDGEYIITSLAAGKSLDVANNSKTSGDIVITYATSGDANQRWTLEKQDDGTYMIKSVHSGLYLSTNGASIFQAEKNQSYKQKWQISVGE